MLAKLCHSNLRPNLKSLQNLTELQETKNPAGGRIFKKIVLMLVAVIMRMVMIMACLIIVGVRMGMF